MDVEEKSKEIYGYQTWYREVGYYISKFEQYKLAIKYFDEAIQRTPDDKKAHLGRAKALLKISHYKEALEDLKTALQSHPNDLVILANKSLVTFLSCEFEEALIQNQRFLKIRKKPDHFYVGGLHCMDAIENCVGERTGHPLRDHFLIIRTLAWKKNNEDQRPHDNLKRKERKKKVKLLDPSYSAEPQKQRKTTVTPDEIDGNKEPPAPVKESSKIIEDLGEDEEEEGSLADTVYTAKVEFNVLPPKIDFPYKPLQNYTSNIENYMSSFYLDVLQEDKLYLKNFQMLPGINVPDVQSTQRVLDLSKSAYKTVCYKQELLRTRRPFYLIKYQQRASSGSLKRRQEEQLLKIQRAETAEAAGMLYKIKQAVKEGNLHDVITNAEKLKIFCDSKQKTTFPNRDNFLSYLYKNSCQAFYDLYKITKAQPLRMERRIKVLLGLEYEEQEGSYDSLAQYFKEQYVDWRKLSGVYTKRLRGSSNSEEAAWLYHELSRFHIEMRQYEIARIYARKCVKEASTIKQNKWVINALMLVIKINMKEKKKNDAKMEIGEALKIAKKLNDEGLVNFLHRTREVIDKTNYGEVFGLREVEKREQRIIEMMEGKMKAEVADLFRKIKALPVSRRISVMPGFRYQDLKEDDTGGRKKNLSISPLRSSSSWEFKKVRPSGPRILFAENLTDYNNST